MKQIKIWLWLMFVVCVVSAKVPAQTTNRSDPFSTVPKIAGPTTAKIRDIAEIKIASGYYFIDGAGLKKLKQAEGEPVSGREMGMISSTNKEWAVMFYFDDMGYVKDDEKDKLDPEALLKTIKAGNERANEYRRQNGGATINVIGWEIPPKYNPETHNLESAIRGESQGQNFLNYKVKLLGRRGVMDVILIVDPDQLTATLPQFRDLLSGFSYQTGQSYAEYRSGDKIAKYGLAALITGGAAVVAVKTGLFAWLILFFKKAWKLVAVAVAAVGAFIKKLVTGDRSNKPSA
jgi:uncharacterized membrane-anchored protein